MESLEHSTTGQFVVATESGSRYFLDFGRQVFVRLPRAVDDLSLTLRGDFYQVRLLALVRCVVGSPMRLRINLGVPGVLFTDRETTLVVAIAEVPADVGGFELDTFIGTLGAGTEPSGAAQALLPLAVEHDGNR
jgi:hypothetical protein